MKLSDLSPRLVQPLGPLVDEPVALELAERGRRTKLPNRSRQNEALAVLAQYDGPVPLKVVYAGMQQPHSLERTASLLGQMLKAKLVDRHGKRKHYRWEPGTGELK